MSTYYENVIRYAYEDSDAYLQRFDDCKGNAFLMRSRARDGFLEDQQNYVIWTTKDRARDYAEEVIKGFYHPICRDISCLSRLFGPHGEEEMILANWVDSVFKSVEGFSSRNIREPNVYANNPPVKPTYVETPNPNIPFDNEKRFWVELFKKYVAINDEFKRYDTLSEEDQERIKKDANDLCNKAVEYITTKAIMKNKRLKRGGRLDCVAIQGAVIEKSNGYDLKVEELPKVVSFIDNFSTNFLNYVNKYEKYLVDKVKNDDFLNTYNKRREEYLKEKRDIEWISGSFVTCLKRGLIYWFEKGRGRRPAASSMSSTGLDGSFGLSPSPPSSPVIVLAPPPLALPPPAMPPPAPPPAPPVVAPVPPPSALPPTEMTRERAKTIVENPREAGSDSELVEAFRYKYKPEDFDGMLENYKLCMFAYMTAFNKKLDEPGSVVRGCIGDNKNKDYKGIKSMIDAINVLHAHFQKKGRDMEMDYTIYQSPCFRLFDSFTTTYGSTHSNKVLYDISTDGVSTDSRWKLSEKLLEWYTTNYKQNDDDKEGIRVYIESLFDFDKSKNKFVNNPSTFDYQKTCDYMIGFKYDRQLEDAKNDVFSLPLDPIQRQNSIVMIVSILMYVKLASVYLKKPPFSIVQDGMASLTSLVYVIKKKHLPTPDQIAHYCATKDMFNVSFDALLNPEKAWLLVYCSTWASPDMRVYCHQRLYSNEDISIPMLLETTNGVFDKDKKSKPETTEEIKKREEAEEEEKKSYGALTVAVIKERALLNDVKSQEIEEFVDEVRKLKVVAEINQPPYPATIPAPVVTKTTTAPATTQTTGNIYGFVDGATQKKTKSTGAKLVQLPLTLGNLPLNQVSVEASANFDKTIKNFCFIPTDKELEFSINGEFINVLDSDFDSKLFTLIKQAELLGVDKDEILAGVQYYTNVSNPIYSSLLAKYKACEKVLTAYYRQYFITKNSGVPFVTSDVMRGEINGLIEKYVDKSHSDEGLIGKLFESARKDVGSRKLVPEEAREILVNISSAFNERKIEKSDPLFIAVESVVNAIGQRSISDDELQPGMDLDNDVIKGYISKLKDLLAFNLPSKKIVGELDEKFKRYLTLDEQIKKRLDLQAAKVAAEETTKMLNEHRMSDAYEILKKLHQVLVNQGFVDMYTQSNDIMRKLKPYHVDDNTPNMDVVVTKAEIDNYFTDLATMVSGFVGGMPGDVKLLKQTYDARSKRKEAEITSSIEKEFTQKELAEDENKMTTILYELIPVFSQMGYDKSLQDTANGVLIALEKEAFMPEGISPGLVLSDVEIEGKLKELGKLKTNNPKVKMGIVNLTTKYNELEQAKKNKIELKKKTEELEHIKKLAEIEAQKLKLKRELELEKKRGGQILAQANGAERESSGTITPSNTISSINSLPSTPDSKFKPIKPTVPLSIESEEINDPPPGPTPVPSLNTDDPMNSARINNKRPLDNLEEEENELLNITDVNPISPGEPDYERSSSNPLVTPFPVTPPFSQSEGSINYEINILDRVANALQKVSGDIPDHADVDAINKFLVLVSDIPTSMKPKDRKKRQENLVLCRTYFTQLINYTLHLFLFENPQNMSWFEVEKWVNYNGIVKEDTFYEYRNAVVALGEIRDIKKKFPDIVKAPIVPVQGEMYNYSQIPKHVVSFANGSDIIGRNFCLIFAAALDSEVTKLEDFLNKGLGGYILKTRAISNIRNEALFRVRDNTTTFVKSIETEQSISAMVEKFNNLVSSYNSDIYLDIFSPIFSKENSGVIVNHIKAIKAGTSELKDTWELYKEFMDAYNQRESIGTNSTFVNDIGLMFELFSKIPDTFSSLAFVITSDAEYTFATNTITHLQSNDSFSSYFLQLFDECSSKIQKEEGHDAIVPLEEDDGTDWQGTLEYVSLPSATSYLAEEQQIQIINNSGILKRMRACESVDSILREDIRNLLSKLAPNPNSLQYEFYNLVNDFVNIENISEENVAKLRSNNKNPIIEFCYLIYQHPDLFISKYQSISNDTLKEIDELYNEIKESFYARKENFYRGYKSNKVQIIKKLNIDLRIYRQNVLEHKIISVSKTRQRLKEAYDNERTDFKKVYEKALDIFTFFKYVEYVYLPSESGKDADATFFKKLEDVLNAQYDGKREKCDALFPLRSGLSGIYMAYKLNGFYVLAHRLNDEDLKQLILMVERAIGVHKEFASSSQLRPYIGIKIPAKLFEEGNKQLDLVLRYLTALSELRDYEKNIYNVFNYKY